MKELIIYLLIALISFFPIIIWAYVFSYIDNNSISRKRFLFWVLWWWISVLPILYFDKMIDFFDLKMINVFSFIYDIKDFLSSLEFWLSLSLFLFFIVLFSFFIWMVFTKNIKILKLYFKNILVFLFFIFLSSLFLLFLSFLLSYFDFKVDNYTSFWNIIFDTFKLIIFYYFIIAFIEESSKHFNFLQSSIFSIKSIKQWVSYGIYIALWFSFIENILYIYNFYEVYWLSSEMLKLYFFRSSFSIIVHIISSAVIAYYFSKAYLLYKDKDLSFPYLKTFLFWLVISILLHMIYDVSITLGFSFIMFIYFIWWYLYVSSIFYDEEE